MTECMDSCNQPPGPDEDVLHASSGASKSIKRIETGHDVVCHSHNVTLPHEQLHDVVKTGYKRCAGGHLLLGFKVVTGASLGCCCRRRCKLVLESVCTSLLTQHLLLKMRQNLLLSRNSTPLTAQCSKRDPGYRWSTALQQHITSWPDVTIGMLNRAARAFFFSNCSNSSACIALVRSEAMWDAFLFQNYNKIQKTPKWIYL